MDQAAAVKVVGPSEAGAAPSLGPVSAGGCDGPGQAQAKPLPDARPGGLPRQPEPSAAPSTRQARNIKPSKRISFYGLWGGEGSGLVVGRRVLRSALACLPCALPGYAGLCQARGGRAVKSAREELRDEAGMGRLPQRPRLGAMWRGVARQREVAHDERGRRAARGAPVGVAASCRGISPTGPPEGQGL